MKEGYKTIDEILKEVAKEEGISLKEVEDIWKHQESYAKKQMDKEGVYAIFLPFIGTLSLNTSQYSKEIKGRIRGLYKTIVNKVSKLKKHENYGEYANAHKKTTGVKRLASKVIKDFETEVEDSEVLTNSELWSIVSKYSNGVYSKKE